MTALHRTVQGEVLDKIVYDHYGHVSGVVEFVLSQNPALRHEDAVLAPGQIVRLPAFTAPVAETKVRLWT